MITRYSKTKHLLFDGLEEDILNKTFEVDTPNGKTTFSFADFESHNFESLKNELGSEDFNTIVQTGGFKTDGGFLNLYQNSDGVRLHYAKKSNVIIVLAYGEKQPMRYMLWLEGVFGLAKL